MKLSICTDLFEDWPQEEVFQFIADKGYQGIEIAPVVYADNVNDISKKSRRKIKKQAAEYGLEVVGLHWVLVGPEGVHLTHPEKSIRKITRDYFLNLLEFCGDIGGELIVFGSPRQRDLLDGVNREDGYRYAADVFSQCMDYAAERGVTICIEPLGQNETNFINSITEAIQLIEMVDHKNFQAMVDIKAALTENRPIKEIIREAAKYLYHIHLNDANGIAPGFGKTDFAPIIEELNNINYNRYLSLEIFELQASVKETAVQSYDYLLGL
ncbi:MAG: sugar phosphate isomerase/epimerase [Firmicutes bacterium]|nr:sugar phosphate isomerase/epimerase [Bacillota bacterium]